jgi:hypothetical protein
MAPANHVGYGRDQFHPIVFDSRALPTLDRDGRYRQRDVLSELRLLWRDCIEGVRRGDPLWLWDERLTRIAELDEYFAHLG